MLTSSSTPTEVTNFMRQIKLSQMRKQLTLLQTKEPVLYLDILAFFNDCSAQKL